MASLITAAACGRYCLIGLVPVLESNMNMLLLYPPVAKRDCSGHDDIHSSAPAVVLQVFILTICALLFYGVIERKLHYDVQLVNMFTEETSCKKRPRFDSVIPSAAIKRVVYLGQIPNPPIMCRNNGDFQKILS